MSDTATHKHAGHACVICTLLMSLIVSLALAALLVASPLSEDRFDPVDLPPVLALSDCLDPDEPERTNRDACLPAAPLRQPVFDTDRMALHGHPESPPMRRVLSTHPPRAPPVTVSV